MAINRIKIKQEHPNKARIEPFDDFPARKLRYLDRKESELKQTSRDGNFQRVDAIEEKQYSRPEATFHKVTITKMDGNGTRNQRRASRIRMKFRTAMENEEQRGDGHASVDAMVVRIVDKQPEPGTYEKVPDGFHEGIYFMKDGQILITKPPAGVEVRVEFVQNDGGGLTDYRC
jgi:hypothetical protein